MLVFCEEPDIPDRGGPVCSYTPLPTPTTCIRLLLPLAKWITAECLAWLARMWHYEQWIVDHVPFRKKKTVPDNCLFYRDLECPKGIHPNNSLRIWMVAGLPITAFPRTEREHLADSKTFGDGCMWVGFVLTLQSLNDVDIRKAVCPPSPRP
jgi:hypothetical protein